MSTVHRRISHATTTTLRVPLSRRGRGRAGEQVEAAHEAARRLPADSCEPKASRPRSPPSSSAAEPRPAARLTPPSARCPLRFPREHATPPSATTPAPGGDDRRALVLTPAAVLLGPPASAPRAASASRPRAAAASSAARARSRARAGADRDRRRSDGLRTRRSGRRTTRGRARGAPGQGYPFGEYATLARAMTAADGSFSLPVAGAERNTRLRVVLEGQPSIASAPALLTVDPAVSVAARALGPGTHAADSAHAAHDRGALGARPGLLVALARRPVSVRPAPTSTRELAPGVTYASAVVDPPARRFSFSVCVNPTWEHAMGPRSSHGRCPRGPLHERQRRAALPLPAYPSAGGDRRGGAVPRRREPGGRSFAVVDSVGHVGGLRLHEHFESASVVKVMMLTAYLQMIAAAAPQARHARHLAALPDDPRLRQRSRLGRAGERRRRGARARRARSGHERLRSRRGMVGLHADLRDRPGPPLLGAPAPDPAALLRLRALPALDDRAIPELGRPARGSPALAGVLQDRRAALDRACSTRPHAWRTVP